MFDPDFDPLAMLNGAIDAIKHQQQSIEVLIQVYNKLNSQVYELSKINSQQSARILKLEAKINAIEQASTNRSIR